MKAQLFQVIKEAGDKILDYYGCNTFEKKTDSSPFTQADKASHDYLIKALPQIKNIPILSEEAIVSYHERRNWKEFWLIDPLDGTKEFISGYDDFCINIALIKNGRPVLGLLYSPILKEFYWAELKKGFEYKGPKHEKSKKGLLVTAISRFHHSRLTQKFMSINNISETVIVGAALKFGRMALGQIDVYPRFVGSKEWDIAAGQIILQEAGGCILDLVTQKPLLYNKKNTKNNFFLSCRKGILLEQFDVKGCV